VEEIRQIKEASFSFKDEKKCEFLKSEILFGTSYQQG
jgi:hypothetical protein